MLTHALELVLVFPTALLLVQISLYWLLFIDTISIHKTFNCYADDTQFHLLKSLDESHHLLKLQVCLKDKNLDDQVQMTEVILWS